MLDLQQQRLPEPLEVALQAAVQAGDGGSPEATRQRLEYAIQVAQEAGYL
jgi:hypothetical protein